MTLITDIKRLLLTTSLLLIVVIYCTAQPKIFSPYSRVGLGNLMDYNHPATMSMGGVSASYSDSYIVNELNPASLSYLQASSFDVGVNIKYASLTSDDAKAEVWDGHLDNFTLAFPLINPINEILEGTSSDFKIGMGISLRPYALVGYNIQSIDSSDISGEINRLYAGDGGLYTVNWGTGARYKQLSFGVSLGYLFGSTNHTRYISFPDLFNSYEDDFRDNIAYSGLLWKAGAQYQLVLKREEKADGSEGNPTKILTLGAYGNLANSFSTKYDQVYLRRNDAYSHRDTLINNLDIEGDGKLPASFGVGLSYRDEKWIIGADYSNSAWSKYTNSARPETLEDSWSANFGASFTPDANSFINYFQRVSYRSGFFYRQDAKGYTQFALTFGAGFPFVNQKQYSFVNAGFEIGKINDAFGIDEFYARARVAFTINNNLWFLKRKYD